MVANVGYLPATEWIFFTFIEIQWINKLFWLWFYCRKKLNLPRETLFCGFQSVLYLFMVLFRLRQYVSWCHVAFRRVHTIRFRWFCLGVFGILRSIGIKLERSSFSFGTWYISNDTEPSRCHIALGHFFHRNRDGFFYNFNYIFQGDGVPDRSANFNSTSTVELRWSVTLCQFSSTE